MPGTFTFRSEILLRIRRRRESAARQRFSCTANDVQAIGGRIDKLRQAYRMHNQALRQMLQDGADAMNMRLYEQCLTELQKSIENESRRLGTARKALSHCRVKLIEAIRQRKGLAVLRDRQSHQHAVQLLRRQTEQHDDLHSCNATARQVIEDGLVSNNHSEWLPPC